MPPSVTLDPSDANFVDIIHSDPNPVMPVGYTESLGHVDFYPNGGSPQPGCMVRDRLFRGIEDGLQDLSVSSAILQAVKCQFVGVKCDNYGDFLNGQCSCDDGQDACAIMGLKAEELFFSGLSGQSSGSKWYLQASGRQPFCYYQYQLIIKLLNNPNCYQGPALIKLSFNFHSDNDQQDGGRQVSVDQTMKNMYAGLRMPYVMTTDEPIGEVYSIFLSWTPIDQDGVVLGQETAHDPVMYLKYIRLSRIEAHYGQNKAPLTNFYHPGNLNSGISPYTSILLHADSIT
ncbi:Lipase member H [Halotydeus destructor]|nr:Lipase member H [Halotydeus destructor]